MSFLLIFVLFNICFSMIIINFFMQNMIKKNTEKKTKLRQLIKHAT